MRFKWFSFGCLTSILVILFFTIMGVRSLIELSKTTPVTKAPSNMILHMKLKGNIQEFSGIHDELFDLVQPNAYVLIQKIRSAAKDPAVRGLLIEPSGIQIGYATMHELILAIEDFKRAQKPVYAYLNMAMNKDYIFASVADKIYLTPSASAGILLTGLGGKRIYWKETFDKIGVEYEVIHAGQYKGAGENYVRTTMSNPVRESISDLYDDIYDEMLSMIANNRNISKQEIKALYENRDEIFVQGQQAIQQKLVDGLKYRDDLYDELEQSPVELFSINSYALVTTENSLQKIAVVYANGTITPLDNGPQNNVLNAKRLNPILDELMDDKSIKAVVLRVNSPGGSALESDLMWNKIEQLKEHKPVVVSMGDVAASGGYFISAPGEYIFADPFTITGSIGVVAMIPNASKLGDKIGINLDGESRGKYADLISVWEPMKEDTKKAFKTSINSTYKEFKSRVKAGRNMTEAQLEPIAQGRVWSSEDAFNNKLVDEIGTLGDAIQKAAEIAKVQTYSVAYFPKVKTLIQYLMEEKFDSSFIHALYKNEIPEEIQEIIHLHKEIQASPIQMRMPLVD